MKLFNKKNLFSTIAILLLLSFVMSLFAVPDANAQSTREIVAYPFVDAIPKTAGVGQPVLINWGLINYLNHYNDGWNVTLRIIDPNGKAENHTGKTWSTGTVGRKMSFMEPGNYTLQCIFDGETYTYLNNQGQTMGGYYKPATSANFTLEIRGGGFWKQDHPGHSLPEEYWTRPVDSQLQEWYSLMGSWVATPPNFYAPWNKAPESAHILWSMPIGDTMGGLSGGDTGVVGFQTGDAYEGKFAGSVIIAGVLYYNRYVSNSPQQTIVAVDLHTGNVLWEKSYNFGGGRISRGQLFNFITENNRGSWAYLWLTSGTNMYALDAKNGDLKFNMTNVPAGTFYYGPNGEMLKYSVATYNGVQHLLRWNSTYVVNRFASASGTSDAWGSQIQGRTFDASLGYDVNVSTGITGSIGNLLTAFPGDRAIFGNISAAGVTLTAISLDSENVGYPLFTRRSWQAPSIWADLTLTTQSRWAAFSDAPYVAIFWTKENRVNYAFSLENGKFLYETEPHGHADAWTNAGLQGAIVDGKLYEASISGVVYCYDAATGEELWTYEATDKYNESYHAENWWLQILFISDGKIYLGHMVHSPTVPITRGAPFFALDIETGDLVWEIDGAFRQTLWGGRALIGDSIIATMDLYDQQIYAIGKGPSEMSVATSNAVTTAGSTVLISGTVMDVSPGTTQANVQYRFTKGVPAVSDESMSNWMLYVYKHFDRPLDVTGVEVVIYAEQNGHQVDIGRTVSDGSGRFAINWTPPADATGYWDIYAYFSGSASYYGSWAKSEMSVLEAPIVVESKSPPYGWYILGAAIVNIVVVLVCMLMIYKKIGKKH